jgi:putative ABC transport system permease protein
MWSFALKTLLADRGKLATTLVGVIFSIVLVNIQGGLFLGLLSKASLLVDFGRADIWVGHAHMSNVDFPQDIPLRWVHRIRSIEGVARAEPYLVAASTMTLPSGSFEQVVIVGCDPLTELGNVWSGNKGQSDHVRHADGIIVDEFEAEKLEHPRLGEIREIGGRRARIVGFSRGIVGFLINPYVFTTIDRARIFARKSVDNCSYFLVQLEPGADASHVARDIQRRLPEASVQTNAEYAGRTIDYWMTRTGLGLSFGGATLMGLLVGLIIVAQTLYASALDRISEFGTLKAMGAGELQVYSILFAQSTTIAFVGALIGLQAVAVIQHSLSSPHVLIIIPWWLSIGSCGLVLAICLFASLLPYLRLRKVDPVMVLQS